MSHVSLVVFTVSLFSVLLDDFRAGCRPTLSKILYFGELMFGSCIGPVLEVHSYFNSIKSHMLIPCFSVNDSLMKVKETASYFDYSP